MKDYNKIWKEIANQKTTTKEDMAARCIIAAMEQTVDLNEIEELSKKLLAKAFTPCYNSQRNEHGWGSSKALVLALNNIEKSKLFEKLTENEKEELAYIASSISFEIDKNGNPFDFQEQRKYIYFFTRKDLSKEQVVVQTAHVALELGHMLAKDAINVKNVYFAVCEAEDQHQLKNILLEIDKHVKTHSFYEPDVGNTMTSFATYPIVGHKRGFMRKFPLLTFKEEKKGFFEKFVDLFEKV